MEVPAYVGAGIGQRMRIGAYIGVPIAREDGSLFGTLCGIAFRAKPKLQEVASMSLNHHERLDTLLYLMGWNERDLRTV